MRIELLHVDDCPNLVLARERIDLALDRVDVTATVNEVLIDSPDAAERAGMSGSPTVLVDGIDPFAGAGPSLACRLYRSGDVVEGAPPVEALVEAFSR